MLKISMILLMAFTGLKALAVDGDFGGQYRLRTSAGVQSSEISNLFKEEMQLSGMDNRAYLSGSFRPSESFEGNASAYVNLNQISTLTPLAYGDWMFSDEFMLRVGRSSYEVADGSVIGMNDYESVPVFFDGVFLTHSSEAFGADVVLAKGYTYTSDNVVEGTDTVAIVSLDVRSFPEVLKKANVHLIAPLSDYTQARAGVTLKGSSMGIGYRATAAVSSLKDIGMDSLLLDGKVSYRHEWDSSALKFYVGGHIDGSSYDAFLYDRHKNAGKLDLVNWGGGLQYGKGGVSYWMDSDFGVGLVGYYFIKTGSQTSVADDGSMELDLYVKKVFDSSVSGKVWLGALRNSTGQVNTKAEAVLQMKF